MREEREHGNYRKPFLEQFRELAEYSTVPEGFTPDIVQRHHDPASPTFSHSEEAQWIFGEAFTQQFPREEAAIYAISYTTTVAIVKKWQRAESYRIFLHKELQEYHTPPPLTQKQMYAETIQIWERSQREESLFLLLEDYEQAKLVEVQGKLLAIDSIRQLSALEQVWQMMQNLSSDHPSHIGAIRTFIESYFADPVHSQPYEE